MSALLTAVRSHLRKQLQLLPGECDCMPTGQPPPGIGPRFIAIHPSNWGPGGNVDTGFHEEFSITVTVTYRLAKMGVRSAMGDLYLQRLRTMESILRQIDKQLDKNYTVMELANDILDPTGGTDLFVQPLFWKGTDAQPRLEPAGWTWNEDTNQNVGMASVVQACHFGEALRPQTSENLE